MGNRAHAIISQFEHAPPIYVYTHWSGPDGLIEQLTDAVNDVARRRIGDPEYFTRIVLQNWLTDNADRASDSGYGVGTSVPDGPLVCTIDSMTGEITTMEGR